MRATLTSKGQLTLPKSARETLGLKAGQRFLVKISKAGGLLLTPERVDPLSICRDKQHDSLHRLMCPHVQVDL